jgi:1,4-dihydroxy-2-naphthoate octaprenyltransferase
MMFYITLGLGIFWLFMNVLWTVLLFIRKKQNVQIPQEIKQTIKRTMRFNIFYVFLFALLGFIFL